MHLAERRWHDVARAGITPGGLDSTSSNSSRSLIMMPKCLKQRQFSVVITGGVLLTAIAVGCPEGQWEEELFPIYSASYKDEPFYGAAHVTATWAYLGFLVPWFMAYSNEEIEPGIYRNASASTMVVYLFHFIFIKPFVYWVLRDFHMMGGAWKLVDPVLCFMVAAFCSMGVYTLLVYFPRVGALFGL